MVSGWGGWVRAAPEPVCRCGRSLFLHRIDTKTQAYDTTLAPPLCHGYVHATNRWHVQGSIDLPPGDPQPVVPWDRPAEVAD